MALNLLFCDIGHTRLRPTRNSFLYKLFYLCGTTKEFEENAKKVRFFSYNKFNLLSFFDRDHGLKNNENPEIWARKILQDFAFKTEIENVVLITLPRILGFVFNPVSFWFCLDKSQKLRGVISEVNNTFGESHSYISCKNDESEITQNDILTTKKIFHVSPFLKIEGHYKFRFFYEEKRIGIWIDYYDNDGLMLTTSMVGKIKEFNNKNIIFCLFLYPFLAFKVLFLIHYQAIKLLLKKIKYIKKPTQLTTKISKN